MDFEALKQEVLAQPSGAFHLVLADADDKESVLVVARSLKDGNRLVVARSTGSLNAQLLNLQKIFWWLLLPVALIGFLGGLFLSNRTLGPVRELLTSMKKLKAVLFQHACRWAVAVMNSKSSRFFAIRC